MALRTLFNIVLKILGIYFLKDFLTLLPQLLYLGLISTRESGEHVGAYPISLTFVTFIYFGLISYLFIFKSNDIIALLKLDRGIKDETLGLNIRPDVILRICIIVIGGLFVAQEIPVFIRQSVLFYKSNEVPRWTSNPNLGYLIAAGIEIVIGILLIVEQRRIVNFILNRSSK